MTTPRARRLTELALWALVAAAMVVLMYESVKPVDAESLAARSDKVAHALAYGAFACIVLAAARVGSGWSVGRAALVAFAWATGYGAVAEIIQASVGRVADVWDALANALGAGIVALAFVRLAVWRRRRGGG